MPTISFITNRIPHGMSDSWLLWCCKVLAALIDNTFIGLLQMGVMFLGWSIFFIFLSSNHLPPCFVSSVAFVVLFALCLLSQALAVVYHLQLEHSRHQSTFGQRQFGFIAVNPGSVLHSAVGQQLWRFIVGPLSAALLLGVLHALLVPARDPLYLSGWIVVASLLLVSCLDALVVEVKAATPASWATTTIPRLQSGALELTLKTARGKVKAQVYTGHNSRVAIVALGGWGNWYSSPARGLYDSIGKAWQAEGVTTMWLRLRKPAELEDAIWDVRATIQYLVQNGFSRIVLIGHSFGGAAVISAAAFEPKVCGLILVSSQTAYTELVSKVAPRPVLIIHGTNDRVIPLKFARDIFNKAQQPKELVLFTAGHSLYESAQSVLTCVHDWLGSQLLKESESSAEQ